MRCSACEAVLAPDARFCSSCGAAAAPSQPVGPSDAVRSYTPPHLAREVLGSRFAREGERKQVTVLFADVVGSTELAERLGADAMHQLLDTLFETSLAAVHRYEGTVNQFLGDGFMALFGAPVAHEDHARRAVRAALEIQRSVTELDLEFGGRRITEIPLRIGLNTGTVVVGAIGDNLRMDYTAIGDSTNIAARVMGQCPAGQVYASESTFRLTDQDVDWKPLGRRPLKGVKDPVGLYQAVRRRSAAVTSAEDVFAASRFVGRDAELQIVTGLVEGLTRGDGRILSVLGEPGLGKSRLMAEVKRRCSSWESPPLWLEARSLSFGASLGYWPFQDMLRRWIGVSEEDGVETVVERLRDSVQAACGDDSDEVLPYLLLMLGVPVPEDLESKVRYLDNQASGSAVFRAMRLLVDRLAERGPVVLVFEDVHWADPASVALAEHLLPLVSQRPLLIVGNARPEQHSAAARLRDAAVKDFGDRFVELRLEPLGPDAGRALVEGLLVGEGLGRLRQRIVERTEGNPFYTEEVIRALAADGVLSRDARDRTWRVNGDVDAIAIPESVQSAIGARIDRLDDEVKQVLKVAAVIGRTFLYRVLEALADPTLRLDEDLENLKLVELIKERRRDPELEFAFTHALIQESAYDSILLEQRRRLHLQVAETAERLFRDRLDEVAGILAHHYAAAQRWDKAQEYLFRAADNAGRIAADTVALAQYEDALEAYGRAFGDAWDPIDRARLERKLADALFRLGRHDQAIPHARAAFRHLGYGYPADKKGVRRAIVVQFLVQLANVLTPTWLRRRPSEKQREVSVERADLADLLGWMDFFLDPERWFLDTLLSSNQGDRSGDPGARVHGYTGLAIAASQYRLHRVSRFYIRRASAIASETGDLGSLAYTKLGEAWHLAYLGRLHDAIVVTAEGERAYAAIGDLRRRSALAGMGIQFARMSGEVAVARERGELVHRLGEEGNDTLLVAWARQNFAFIESNAGDPARGRALIGAALETYREIPSWNSVAEGLGDLGTCCLREGRLDDASAVLEEAWGLISEHGLVGYSVSYPALRRAQVRLLLAERAGPEHRSDALAAAGEAIKDASRIARLTPGAQPWLLQLQGTWSWLRGDADRARHRWAEAIGRGAECDVRYAPALALYDRGRLTASRADLESALAAFDDLDMTWDAREVRVSLDGAQEAA